MWAQDQMMPDLTEKIRKRAHLIWERQGRPHGRAEQHWEQAVHEIENEEAARVRAVADGAEKTSASGGDADKSAATDSAPDAPEAAPSSPLSRRR